MNTISIRIRGTAVALTMALLVTLAFTPQFVAAHDGEDHGTDRETAMHELVEVLQQLIALLQQQVEMQGGMAHDDEHDTHDEALRISVEEHGGTTHVHVYVDGVETSSFFLEDIVLSDHDAAIAAIAEREGLTEAEVEAAAEFAAHEETEHHEADSHGDMDLSGIHIMGDGTVMLGNGEALDDATVNDEGMIVLGDGTVVEPEHDLRADDSDDA